MESTAHMYSHILLNKAMSGKFACIQLCAFHMQCMHINIFASL